MILHYSLLCIHFFKKTNANLTFAVCDKCYSKISRLKGHRDHMLNSTSPEAKMQHPGSKKLSVQMLTSGKSNSVTCLHHFFTIAVLNDYWA